MNDEERQFLSDLDSLKSRESACLETEIRKNLAGLDDAA